MKYAFAFIASFILVAGLTAVVRVSASDAPIADSIPQEEKKDTKEDAPKKDAKDPHHGHDMGDKKDNSGKDEKKDKEKSEWDGEVETDLKNEKDPVNGKEVGDSEHHVVFHGFKVHFADEKSIKKFKRRPIQFLTPLELEKTTDGEVKKVDPADFKDPPIIPDTC
ncbi:MAG: hypothetical protein KDB29_13330, partial [Planctomycetes bacterium]|nr:hypothetical protein [Planctomycetota bacterium]